ncbi:aromatic-ring-hydroxylating dioxygenase subunit beta [Streptomyces sp. A1-5]|uniref:aromatic-ring-hydroxylating dioxygenase subunit beta n=1 Tax=Streptomyces sp. A1-5 TaxID=2738410 RepID=UPI001F3B175D|nr:aromatic-ring-hydroxylating dioxygenase subunit beta [Streptomyces sp. A1-5]UJB39658.1 ring-hydroxylating dioxygenase subunit beta [Streptomyces sp. A1-5]
MTHTGMDGTGTELDRAEPYFALVRHEARLLDTGRYDDWLRLYADDATYWVPVDPAATDPEDSLSIICDDRKRILDRLFRLSSGYAHAEVPPSTVRRVVSGCEVSPCPHGADTDVVSTFVLVHARLGRQGVIAGDYLHCLSTGGQRPLIRRKRVGLLDPHAVNGPLAFLL